MNNRKQQINSLLNSLTEREIDEYVKDKKININKLKLLERIKFNKPIDHRHKISNDIGSSFNKDIEKMYKLGTAYIIAFVLVCFYDDKYKILDLKQYLKAMIDGDKKLKEYVYDCMKDF